MGGFNTFAYAPNPIQWIDPLGLAKKDICKASDLGWKSFSTTKTYKVDGKSLTSLQYHYDKHGHEFGNISQSQYAKMAREFAATDTSTTVDTIVGNTFVVKMDTLTGTIFVGNIKSRIINTFYKDDGRDEDPYAAAIALAASKCGL